METKEVIPIIRDEIYAMRCDNHLHAMFCASLTQHCLLTWQSIHGKVICSWFIIDDPAISLHWLIFDALHLRRNIEHKTPERYEP